MKKKTKENDAQEFSAKQLTQDIYNSAMAVGLPEGAAKQIATQVANKVAGWVEKRSVITSDDLNRRIAAEAKNYNEDLAYVYENRGKII